MSATLPPVLSLAPTVIRLVAGFFPGGGTAVTIAGEVADVLPGLLSAAQTEINLFTSATPPTAEQLATIQAALDQSEALLQSAQQGAPLNPPPAA